VQVNPPLHTHRYLLGQLIKRDVLLRYRGAMFGAALVHGAFNFLILLAALAWTGHLTPSVILYPLMLLPLLLLALGLSWFFAAWGVFIKDMNQIVPPFVQMLMFLSPVLYPASAAPESLRPLYHFNPLGTAGKNLRMRCEE
jgi:lipopolysaccharide transport system permease protein